MTTLNLHQRMDKVRQAVDYIQKQKPVEGYKAVTHDQVTGMLREHLIKNGITTVVRFVSGQTVDTGGKTSKGTTIVRFEAVYEVDFVNIDDPKDRETHSAPAHANDHGDKAPGKTVSYAVKTILLKAFNIETGENDESRYGSDDEEGKLDADEIIAHETAFKSATTRGELRAMLSTAHEAAKAAGDHYAHKRFTATAGELAGNLPDVKQPQSKSAKEQPAAVGDDESIGQHGRPSAAPPADPNEPKASAGLVKMIEHAIKERGVADVSFYTGGVPLKDLPKSQAAALLKTLSELKA